LHPPNLILKAYIFYLSSIFFYFSHQGSKTQINNSAASAHFAVK